MYVIQQFFEEVLFPKDNIIVASEIFNDDSQYPSHFYLSTHLPLNSESHISFQVPPEIRTGGSYMCYLNLFSTFLESDIGSPTHYLNKEWPLIRYARSMSGFKIVDRRRIYFFMKDYSQLFKLVAKLMADVEHEPNTYVLLYRLGDLKEIDLVDLYLESEVFFTSIDVKQSREIDHIINLLGYLLGLSFDQLVKWLAELKPISSKLHYIETKVIINPIILNDITNSSISTQVSKEKQIMADFFPNCFLICNECHIDIYCTSCNTSMMSVE